MTERDPYFLRPEVSNSDLTALKEYWMDESYKMDLEKAFADGTLIDAIITESYKVDYFKYRIAGYPYQFTKEDFEKAKRMKDAFMKDSYCQMMIRQCSFQKISLVPEFKITYDGFEFTLPARCKWDLFCDQIDLGGDIKSTVCTTQKQCEESLYHFDYDRSRAWYMDLENRTNDIIIFISKVNFKIFKVPVKRGGEIYKSGRAKYEELAFNYYCLFGNLKNIA